MPAARTGSVVPIPSSANSGSQSVSIPVGTTFVLMLAGGWPDQGPTFFTGAGFTLDGSPFTLVTGQHADGSHNNTTIWRLSSPSTGTVTFAWDWGGSGAASEGMTMFLIPLSGVDLGNPIRGSGGASAESSSGSTGSMTGQSGDYAAAVTSHAGSASFTGATELEDATFNGAVQALAEQPSVSGNVTISVTASDFVAISGVVVAGLSMALELEGYRGRNDDGDEDGATWIQAQDVAFDASVDSNFRLRTVIDATGDPPTGQFSFRYRLAADDPSEAEVIS